MFLQNNWKKIPHQILHHAVFDPIREVPLAETGNPGAISALAAALHSVNLALWDRNKT